jgi:hypothetical protein
MDYRMRRDEEGKLHKVVVFDGVEGYWVSWTRECSGCTEHGESGGRTWGPFGCDECGYTGKRRQWFWTPFDLSHDPRLRPAPAAAVVGEASCL